MTHHFFVGRQLTFVGVMYGFENLPDFLINGIGEPLLYEYAIDGSEEVGVFVKEMPYESRLHLFIKGQALSRQYLAESRLGIEGRFFSHASTLLNKY